MQLVIGQQDGSTYSMELEDSQANALQGLQMGDEVDGSAVGLQGYTLEITGGSDRDGFPMKKQLQGTARRKVLVTGGTGIKGLEDGERRRISLRGNTVADDIAQLNCRVVEEGDKSIKALVEGGTEEEDSEGDKEPNEESEESVADEEGSGDEPSEEKTDSDGETDDEEQEGD